MPNLEERLGREPYRKRREIERLRLREYHSICSRRMVFLKVRVVRPILSLALRLSGLYRLGYRQFHDIRINHNTVPIANLPESFAGFRILQMSDLHIDLDETLVDSIGKAIQDIQYDLCVLTGDYRNSTIGAWQQVVEPLAKLMRYIDKPVLAILGNHDFIDMVPALEELGIRFLLNESTAVTHRGAQLVFTGIDDPNIYATHDFAHALEGVDPATPKVLLSHSPAAYAEAAQLGFGLLLAGHTHGGQICLPGGIMIARNDKSPRPFLRGAWQYKEMRGYTSVGTGACGLPVRLNCPPEATLHTLSR